MKRAFLSFLMGSVLLAASTMAGMAVFGMSGTMSHADSPMGTSGVDCIEHCLSVASSVTAVAAPLPLTLVALILSVAILLSEWIPAAAFRQAVARHWREGIGKLRLRQNLSVVILID